MPRITAEGAGAGEPAVMDTLQVPPLPEILTAEQAAAYLQVHRLTVYGYVRRGLVPAVRLGRLIRIRREDLRRLLETRAARRDG